MALIRVGFLGLSNGGWARGAHLPYLEKSENYQIVAICNSSKLYNLPEGTRAYGNPEGILAVLFFPTKYGTHVV
jgi:predicted dehydrogenase